MVTFDLREFLARSTDHEFDDTALAKVLRELPSLSTTGPWLAGGALRRTLRRESLDSDFDFFFADASQLATFAADLQSRGLVQIKETEHHLHFRGRVGEEGTLIDAQCIRFAYYANAAAVIDSFDFTICQFATDGTTLTVGDYSLWDLGRQRLAINRITFPVSSMRRLLKYGRQGFKACNGCLSGLLRATVDHPELRTDIQYVD